MISEFTELELLEDFKIDFANLSTKIYENNKEKGFWGRGSENRNRPEMIALMHSELSEALEGIRHGNPPDQHCPEFSSVEVELADTIIRIMDYNGGFNLDVGGAIIAKLAYNKTRPYKHVKKF